MNTTTRWILLLGACALSLTGCGGGGSGGCSSTTLGSLGSLACGSSSSNQAPVALIAAPSNVAAGSSVALDGSASRDPDGQSLTYRWELVNRPAGSQAVLSDAASARPTFLADIQGSYTVRLIVSDGKADSAPATLVVTVTRSNQAPVAKAPVRASIPSTSLSIDAAARLGALEERVGAMMSALESCIKENLTLHRQIDDLMQRQMQAEGWMYTSGSSSELTLR